MPTCCYDIPVTTTHTGSIQSGAMPGSPINSIAPLHEIEAQKGDAQDNRGYGCCGWLLYFGSILLILLFLPLSIWGVVKVIPDYQRAVIFRLGRARKQDKMASGLFCIVPCIDDVRAHTSS